ncbi:MAG: amidohydrolase family protein [Anaerolineaceae bacterium]|nr:amidohydrolase family protein [Anaerolineaceae bacterium]
MKESFDILIKNGLVVNADGIAYVDVAVNAGKISAVEANLDNAKAKKVIDAQGKYIFPGLFDVHVHPVYVDDMGHLSKVAAHGGITTLMHHGYIKPDQEFMPTLETYIQDGENKSVLDFALHVGLFDVENQLQHIPTAMKMGISSFKAFMTYAKKGWITDDYWLCALSELLASEKGLLMVHAENGLVTDYLEDRMLREKHDPAEQFMHVCRDLMEAEAISRALSITHLFQCALYIVHNSAADSLEPLRRALAQKWNVIGETCPQYLALNDDTTQSFGAQAKMGPPLRTKADNAALWKGLADGTISTVASDHAPKVKSKDEEFFAAQFGSPSTETMAPIVYHEGVNKGRISLPRFVEVMSKNPAEIWGLYPQKGSISVGADADIVVFDPTIKWTISRENQHSNAGYSLYEGREVLGKAILSMQRGQNILENGEIVASDGQGSFLRTNTSHLYQ